jgi:hypothetical protein
MQLKRLTLPFACLLVSIVFMWAGAASAQKTFLLGAGSGGQFQIGGGLPLPAQLTDAVPPPGPDWGAVPSMPIMTGTSPTKVVSEVNMIGRKRRPPASTAAS